MGELVDTHTLAEGLREVPPHFFAFGAFGKEYLKVDYASKMLNFSEYSLSAGFAIARLIDVFSSVVPKLFLGLEFHLGDLKGLLR